jgi:hypothetical protein
MLINIIGYSVVAIVIGGILGAMVMVIKMTTDDTGKQGYLKEMVEALFGTPAHLRPPSPEEKKEAIAPHSGNPFEAFTEACPACDTAVTHMDKICPSCDLKLLD